MSFSFGGLGLLSIRRPFSDSVVLILSKSDIRSLFCLLIFSIVTLVLAYLTNPSENSFRAFLIEQSFRQHLTRLDVSPDDDNASQDGSTSSHLSRRTTLAKTHALSLDNSSSFHFANRASVSLRTPKHVFHSFGIFTIAAMAPLSKSASNSERDTLIPSDSWYVGIFGRWWRGGVLDAWYQDIIARSNDEEGWTSGILSMKNFDLLNEYNGLPFSTKNLPPHLLARGSPPKLRNREKSSTKNSILPTRNSSPPPLPKSVSLPLHIARLPVSSSADRPSVLATQPLSRSPSSSCRLVDQVHLGSSLPSRSPSTLFDQSPNIAEVLRQISLSKTSVHDLRTQLTDYQACSAQSHAQLQSELDSLRDRKRQEDASKLDTKARTKTFDDSRRHTETVKRDAEKRLKSTQNARDSATQRMAHLDKEIAKLQQQILEDEMLIRQSKESASEAEQEISVALDRKKHEIKVAEDVVSALNQRARELEESVNEAKEKLAGIKERNETQRQDRILRTAPQTPWDAVDGFSAPDSEEQRHLLSGFESLGHRPSLSRDSHTLPKSGSLALSTNATMQTVLRANGYSVFDDSILTAHQRTSHQSHQLSTTFSPFGDGDMSRGTTSVISPTSQSLISSALATSLDSPDGVSRSFQSENDVYMDKEWRGRNMTSYIPYNAVLPNDRQDTGFMSIGTSPISLHGPSSPEHEHDPFDSRFVQTKDGHRNTSQETALDHRRTLWDNSAPNSQQHSTEDSDATNSMVMEKISPRRWFSTTSRDKAKKGLNPDAKVFTLARKPTSRTSVSTFSNPSSGISSTYDALNPNGLGSQVASTTTSTNNSLLRAFAPSPAEREVLQRALGGSTNTSFERLPSLSDVGSIPSSPSHVHELPAVTPQQLAGTLPSWLQSLPRFRKANFSPWEDEEPVSMNGNGVSGVQHY